MSNILIVYAHPEPKSLNGALKDLAVETLQAQGHTVRVSDLYQSDWNAAANWADFRQPAQPERLRYAWESANAFAGGSQAPEIEAEQEKLLWADAVLLNFPMWWFSMPAILKGWVERVFALGFAYGRGVHDGERWGDRYGEGILAGRRAMLTVTMGGREAQYGRRGVNGSLDDLLWPIQHGVLFYPGLTVMEPFALYQADRVTEETWPELADAYRRRLEGLFTDEPIPFRTQNGGHYDGTQVLKPGLGDGESGTRIHLVQAGDPEEVLVRPAAAKTPMAEQLVAASE
ncbi:MAG TPA: NAD(P)H-dependent oxidoreductase [Caulobacteraceae bacterium]